MAAAASGLSFFTGLSSSINFPLDLPDPNVITKPDSLRMTVGQRIQEVELLINRITTTQEQEQKGYRVTESVIDDLERESDLNAELLILQRRKPDELWQ